MASHNRAVLNREGTGKKGNPYTYSVNRNDSDGEAEDHQKSGDENGSEKGGLLVPTIYREPGNQKNQNNSTPGNGPSLLDGDSAGELQSDLREPETHPQSGTDVVEV